MKVGGLVLLLGSALTINAAIRNGSFEEPIIGSLYTPYLAGENIGGWVVESGSVEIVGTYWQAAEGNQSLDLSGIWEWAGTLYQDLPTTPGHTYKVRFAFAGNPEDQAVKDAKIFWNETELAQLSVDTAGRSFTNMGWTYYTYDVTATSTISRLKFQSLTLNFLGPLIDDVSVTPVEAAKVFSNGSFESPVIGVPYQVFSAGENIGGWIVESGTVEIVGPYWQAAEGKQSLDLSGIWDLLGTIYQDVPTIPGQSYKVRFAFAGNPEDQAVKEAKVFWNNTELAHLTVDTAGRSLQDMGWKYYSYTIKATEAVSRLRFESHTHTFLGPVIDDVSIVPVVPSTLTADLVVRIKVSGTPGDRYRIDYSPRVNNPDWQELTTVTVPNSGEIIIFDEDGLEGRQRTYRSELLGN